MATNTMVALRTATVTNSSTTSVSFTSLPSIYTDLQIVVNGGAQGGDIFLLQFNGDTAGNYSETLLWGNGSSASSQRTTGNNWISIAGKAVGLDVSLNNIGIAHVMNYANTSTYKTVLSRQNTPAGQVGSNVGTWRSTAAITSLVVATTGNNMVSGTTITIYGIANADIGAYATGGIITYDANYYYHAFAASGTFTPKQALTADILVVAGGGGGGYWTGGGGGAGGVTAFASQSLASGTAYTCTVGAGGGGGVQATPAGGQGSNSQFAALTAAVGGGGGGGIHSVPGYQSYPSTTGGSGGGGGSGIGSPGDSGSAGTSGQGYAGGNGIYSSPNYAGGGGGGAGGAGTNGTGNSSGSLGGTGINSNATFTNLSTALTVVGYGVNGYIAGGGSAYIGTGTTPQPGGNGGGGTGGTTGLVPGGNGVAATGSGGGAGGWDATNSGGNGGKGGSGIIIVRYAK